MGLSLILGVALIPIILVWKPWNIGKRERGLPPGPPTTPILGNALQFPKEFPHFKFTQWAREYGEIFSFKILNQTLIVLSSPAAVRAILDKQGLITGNRPKSHMIERTEGIYTVLQNMDTHAWRTSRKASHTFLTPEAIASHWTTQRAEFAQFLNDLIDTPQDLYTHVRRTTASVMITLIYGKRCPTYEGTEAERFFIGTTLLNKVVDPIANPPVDLIPLLKHVPSRWAKWKELCERTRVVREGLYTELLVECEERIGRGERTGCFLENVIESREELDMTREEIKAMGKVLMDGGIETTTSILHTFILALTNFPECQKIAQAEIDRVVGSERLPEFEDYENLPYVRGLLKEVLRFRPVFPIGLPHVATQDLIYKDYRIPKDSIIFTNLWAMYRNPGTHPPLPSPSIIPIHLAFSSNCISPIEFFKDPDSFKPERYLKTRFGTISDDGSLIDGWRDNLHFGSGRRICPGAEMGSKNLAINTMNLLWAFNFTKDDSGTGDINIESYGKPGTELCPNPFSCNVIVRDEARKALIRDWYASTL